MRSLRHHVGIEHDLPAAAATSARSRRGRRCWPRRARTGRPGLGSSATISACASRSRSSSAPVAAISFFRSRRASSGRWFLQTMMAIICASQRSRVRSCSVRHSPGRGRRRRSAPCSAGSAGRSAGGPAADRRRRSRPRGALDVAEAALAQPAGDVLERVGEVAVVVERIDQHHHRGGVGGREAHARELAAQVVLQRLASACRARWRRTRRRRCSVRALPGVSVMPSKSSRSVPFSQSSRSVLPKSAAPSIAAGSSLRLDRRSRRRARIRARRHARPLVSRSASGSNAGAAVFLGFEERVLLEHLLDFLVQLERRQLQQADRLLQLRRQRQVLRQAELERGLHGQPAGGRGTAPEPDRDLASRDERKERSE